MIDSKEVIAFFDRLAPDWDAEMIRSDEIIAAILDKAEVSAGKDVLDVATGTGVLIGDYLARGVASVTGIDISPNMARIAQGKYPQENVKILCGDVERTDFERLFDCIVVYNAFPHFPDPETLIRRLSSLLRTGGMLTVAHGMSRDEINARHREEAKQVSMGLMDAEELAAIFAKYLEVRTVISTDKMYQVAGLKA